MTKPGSLKEFLGRLETLHAPQEAIEFIELSIADVATWPKEPCGTWVVQLLSWMDEDWGNWNVPSWPTRYSPDLKENEPTSEDVDALLVRLLQALFDRCRGLRVDIPLGKVEGAVSRLTIDWGALCLPRRLLIAAYRQWIEDDFVPGLTEYSTQAQNEATAIEKVELTESLRTADSELSDLASDWIKVSLRAATSNRPELIPEWLQHVRNTKCAVFGDPWDEPILNFYEGWLKRLPAGPSLPPDVAEHIVRLPLDRSLVSQARTALDATQSNSWQVHRQTLEMLLERDVGLLNPQLPKHVSDALCGGAKSILTSYWQLRLCGGTPPVVGCAHLTMALEAQIRWALARKLHPTDARRVRELGLRSLARFAQGLKCSALTGLEPTADPSDEELFEFLHRAGQIRNQLHHDVSKLSSQDLSFLHGRIFDRRKIQAMSRIRVLRCRRCPSTQ